MLQGIEFLHAHDVIHRDIKGKIRKFGNEYSMCVYVFLWIREQLNVNINHTITFIAKEIDYSFYIFMTLQNPFFF